MRRTRFAALFGAALMSLLLPTSASAAVHELRHLDQLNDVVYYPLEQGPGSDIPHADPTRTIGDVRGLHAEHRTDVVHLALYIRSLPRAGIKNEYDFGFKMPTTNPTLQIVSRPGNWKGVATFRTYSGKPISCHGLRFLIEYSHKRVVLDVPRSCLGNPEYLRVGGQTVFFTNDRVYADDALSDGAGYAGTFIYGPALHR